MHSAADENSSSTKFYNLDFIFKNRSVSMFFESPNSNVGLDFIFGPHVGPQIGLSNFLTYFHIIFYNYMHLLIFESREIRI